MEDFERVIKILADMGIDSNKSTGEVIDQLVSQWKNASEKDKDEIIQQIFEIRESNKAKAFLENLKDNKKGE